MKDSEKTKEVEVFVKCLEQMKICRYCQNTINTYSSILKTFFDLLSKKLLVMLREYCKEYRPKEFLFEGAMVENIS